MWKYIGALRYQMRGAIDEEKKKRKMIVSRGIMER
jgi:hypothetical protein